MENSSEAVETQIGLSARLRTHPEYHRPFQTRSLRSSSSNSAHSVRQVALLG